MLEIIPSAFWIFLLFMSLMGGGGHAGISPAFMWCFLCAGLSIYAAKRATLDASVSVPCSWYFSEMSFLSLPSSLSHLLTILLMFKISALASVPSQNYLVPLPRCPVSTY